MGARDTIYASTLASGVAGNYAGTCPLSKVGFQPGSINDTCDQAHFWSWHPAGANWTFGDGSARFVTYSIDSPPSPTTTTPLIPVTTLMQLCTRNGGEVPTGDY